MLRLSKRRIRVRAAMTLEVLRIRVVPTLREVSHTRGMRKGLGMDGMDRSHFFYWLRMEMWTGWIFHDSATRLRM